MSSAHAQGNQDALLEKPRIEDGKPLLLAGMRKHYTSESLNEIPALWQRFAPHLGKIAGQVGNVAYGVVLNPGKDGACDYLACVEISGGSELPAEFVSLRIPAQKYAVFVHGKQVSRLRETIQAIWREWLPSSGYRIAHPTPEGLGLIERYGEAFDPRLGMGDVEVWVPIVAGAGGSV